MVWWTSGAWAEWLLTTRKCSGRKLTKKMSERWWMIGWKYINGSWYLILPETICECQGIPHFNLLWSMPAWHHSHLKVVTFQLIPKYQNCSVYRPVLLNWLGGPKMDAFIGSRFLWWQNSEAVRHVYAHIYIDLPRWSSFWACFFDVFDLCFDLGHKRRRKQRL